MPEKKVAEATEGFSLLLQIFPTHVFEIAQLLTFGLSHLLRCVIVQVGEVRPRMQF